MLKNILLPLVLITSCIAYSGENTDKSTALIAHIAEYLLQHTENLTHPVSHFTFYNPSFTEQAFNIAPRSSSGRAATSAEIIKQVEDTVSLLKTLNLITAKKHSNAQVKTAIVNFSNLLAARKFTFPSNMDRVQSTEVELFKKHQQQILNYVFTPIATSAMVTNSTVLAANQLTQSVASNADNFPCPRCRCTLV